MKNPRGFGIIELFISAAIISSLCFFFLKIRQRDRAMIEQTFESQGALPSPAPTSTSSAAVSLTTEQMTEAAGKSLKSQIEKIEKTHLDRMDCQVTPGANCK